MFQARRFRAEPHHHEGAADERVRADEDPDADERDDDLLLGVRPALATTTFRARRDRSHDRRGRRPSNPDELTRAAAMTCGRARP